MREGNTCAFRARFYPLTAKSGREARTKQQRSEWNLLRFRVAFLLVVIPRRFFFRSVFETKHLLQEAYGIRRKKWHMVDFEFTFYLESLFGAENIFTGRAWI